MTTIALEYAEEHLSDLMDQAQNSHQPIHIVGKSRSAVVVFSEDWAAIEEPLYLQSIPGITEPIREGVVAPDSEYSETVVW